jgi:hypothetical protein
LTVNDVCAALFVSGLQRLDASTGDAVEQAGSRTMRQFGVRSCAGLMAQKFGDHLETAMDRMQWIRQLAAGIPARSCPRPRSRQCSGTPKSCVGKLTETLSAG